MQVIASDINCEETCVQQCSYGPFPQVMACVMSNCGDTCDTPIKFDLTQYFEIKPKADVSLSSCSVNQAGKFFCTGTGALVLTSNTTEEEP